MNRTRKLRIIREQVKDRHTSHWDLDLLGREELEALMAKRRAATDPAEGAGHDTDREPSRGRAGTPDE